MCLPFLAAVFELETNLLRADILWQKNRKVWSWNFTDQIWLDQGKHAVAFIKHIQFSIYLNRILGECPFAAHESSRPSTRREKLSLRAITRQNNVEWESGASATQRSSRKGRLYLLVAKIFMLKVESDKSHL